MDPQVCLLYKWLTASLSVKRLQTIKCHPLVFFTFSALRTSRSSQCFGSYVIVPVTQHEMSVLRIKIINREGGLMFVYSAVFVQFKPRPSIIEINAGAFSHREEQNCMFSMCWWSLLWRWREKKVSLAPKSSTFPISFSLLTHNERLNGSPEVYIKLNEINYIHSLILPLLHNAGKECASW